MRNFVEPVAQRNKPVLASTMKSIHKLTLMAAIASAVSFVPSSMPGLNLDLAQAGGNKSFIRISKNDIGKSRRLKLGLNKSLVIELPGEAHDILVANPVVADAVTRTSTRLYLFGKQVGMTNIFVFDGAGRQLLSLDLDVERDIAGLDENIRRFIPGSDVEVEILNDNVILTGSVPTPQDAAKAVQIAQIFLKGGEATSGNFVQTATSSGGNSSSSSILNPQRAESNIVNLLKIEGEDQVHLKVTVAEISRNVVKQLGIDLDGSVSPTDGFNFRALGDNPFQLGRSASNSGAALGFNSHGNGTQALAANIRALEQTGVMKTLAEPTLTAISGEQATFSVGGSFYNSNGKNDPGFTVDENGNKVPAGAPILEQEQNEYGIGLSFTPVVLSPGRISLKIRTEVSEPTSQDSIAIPRGQIGSASHVGIRRRVADTTVELPSGGSMVIAGLIQDDVRQTISGFPGLRRIPIFGTLFRSKEFRRYETELVIIVTPYLVRPQARQKFARPDDNFNATADGAGYFMGRLNRVYGTTTKKLPKGRYHGNVGFIMQ